MLLLRLYLAYKQFSVMFSNLQKQTEKMFCREKSADFCVAGTWWWMLWALVKSIEFLHTQGVMLCTLIAGRCGASSSIWSHWHSPLAKKYFPKSWKVCSNRWNVILILILEKEKLYDFLSFLHLFIHISSLSLLLSLLCPFLSLFIGIYEYKCLSIYAEVDN